MVNKTKKSAIDTNSDKPLPGEFSEESRNPYQYRGMNRFMVLIIMMAMIPWLFGSYQIFGFKITGWTWVIPASIAVFVCLGKLGRIAFPFGLWMPWTGILLIYWWFGKDNPNALQSLLQMLSPLAVGCAASIFRSDSHQLAKIIRWISRLALISWVLLLVRVPMILTGALPGYSFMAPEMIGLLLLGSCYASFYACGSGRHLYYYSSMLAITVISLTRGPIVAMLSCLPLTPAPLKIYRRILFCGAMIICALIIFNTERIQQRMFWSGSGELKDLRWSNPDLRKSGRDVFYNILWPEVEDRPWFGNGFNSYRSIFTEFGLATYLPHNDWLKLLHDMGIVGAGLYLLTIVLQALFLIKIAQRSAGTHRMLAYGAATAFIPYALIMLTDNVILYVQFFGNLHFALIGIVYGTLRRNKGINNV
jgi:hypothetical protein